MLIHIFDIVSALFWNMGIVSARTYRVSFLLFNVGMWGKMFCHLN